MLRKQAPVLVLKLVGLRMCADKLLISDFFYLKKMHPKDLQCSLVCKQLISWDPGC